MFNSREYSFADISVVMLGRPITGLRGVKYKATQEKEIVHGAGNKPLSIAKGKKTFEGSLTLLQSELEALLVAAGTGKDVMDLNNIDVIVTYEPNDGLPFITDILKNVQFKEFEKGMKVNDMFTEIDIPFFCLDIQYGV